MAWDELPKVDVEELGSDGWWKGYFPDRGTRFWRRDLDELRRRDLALFALGDVAGKDVLDVACGSGLYLVLLGLAGAKVAGQDISQESIEEAKVTLSRRGVTANLQTGNASKLLFVDGSFDAVMSGDFVEHILDDTKRKFFSEVYRVLRPGGVFIIKTPNKTYLRAVVYTKRLAALARGRSPFGIHIEHTRNNPNNEHHGLTTYPRLRRLLTDALFHDPVFIRQPLSKRPLPWALQYGLPYLPLVWPLFNRDLIVRTRKPLGLGFFP